MNLLQWSLYLFLFSVLLQAIEYFFIEKALTKKWPLFLSGLQVAVVVFCFLTDFWPNFVTVAWPQFPILFLILFAILVALIVYQIWRWRGAFNGASDAVTLLTSLALLTSLLLPKESSWTQFTFMFLTVQILFSYFIGGLVKIKNPNWRSGRALAAIFQTPQFATPTLIQKLASNSSALLGLSWLIMLWEISFPFLIYYSQHLWFVLAFGLLFHSANALIFGLNRFFWAWLPIYPLIMILAQNLK